MQYAGGHEAVKLAWDRIDVPGKPRTKGVQGHSGRDVEHTGGDIEQGTNVLRVGSLRERDREIHALV